MLTNSRNASPSIRSTGSAFGSWASTPKISALSRRRLVSGCVAYCETGQQTTRPWNNNGCRLSTGQQSLTHSRDVRVWPWQHIIQCVPLPTASKTNIAKIYYASECQKATWTRHLSLATLLHCAMHLRILTRILNLPRWPQQSLAIAATPTSTVCKATLKKSGIII